MARIIKFLGLCALFHASNAGEINCASRADFGKVGGLKPGECTSINLLDTSKLTITENVKEGHTSQTILPFTHYTTAHPTSIATQDFVHFKDEEKPLQAYTYYTPQDNAVTICSPYECIQLPKVSTEFFITFSITLTRDDCPEKFIHAYNSALYNRILGVCVTLSHPGKEGTVRVESTPSSFFYLSREPAIKYHIIDHRSFPPKEIISQNIIEYSVSRNIPLLLAHLVDYNDSYFSRTRSPQSPGVLGVTGTYYALQQRKDRRYMVQTPTDLYSLVESDSILSLKREDESYYKTVHSSEHSRRILLQVFPDDFAFPSNGLSPAMQYSALYKEAYGYENRKVDRTITGAHAFMSAVRYTQAIRDNEEGRGNSFLKLTKLVYIQRGDTYLYSVPTYLRCMNKEKELKELKKALREVEKKDWDQLAQEAPLNDVGKTIHAKDAEGGFGWYSLEGSQKATKVQLPVPQYTNKYWVQRGAEHKENGANTLMDSKFEDDEDDEGDEGDEEEGDEEEGDEEVGGEGDEEEEEEGEGDEEEEEEGEGDEEEDGEGDEDEEDKDEKDGADGANTSIENIKAEEDRVKEVKDEENVDEEGKKNEEDVIEGDEEAKNEKVVNAKIQQVEKVKNQKIEKTKEPEEEENKAIEDAKANKGNQAKNSSEKARDESTAKQLTLKEPTVKVPTVKEPTLKKPTVKKPLAKDPTIKEPTVKVPTIKEPTIKEPTIKKPTVNKEKGVEEEETANGWAKKLWRVGRVGLLVVLVLGMIVFFVRRLRKKPSVDQVHSSSALLSHEVQQII